MTKLIHAALTTTSLLFSSSRSSNVVNCFSSNRLLKRRVSVTGTVSLRSHRNRRQGKLSPSSTHSVGERPQNPELLTSNQYLEENVDKLANWFNGKKNVLCLTGAGVSTMSGIPDYRGHNGSYHKGHKPMVHDQFVSSTAMRQRYWGRAMNGWREFAMASPNDAHFALAELEEMGFIGVDFDDNPKYHSDANDDGLMKWAFTDGSQKMSIITQNVDGLHRKAGSKSLTELHGRGDRLKCMNCGAYHCRHEFHDVLEDINSDWLEEVKKFNDDNMDNDKDKLRPDGDAYIAREVYDDVKVPSCNKCGSGFYKPDVVFFGDSVPRHRVERSYGAVEGADGLLCVGTSLAVHSAFRFVQHAAKKGIPIAILNVGETRAEVNELDLLKIEASASHVLKALVEKLKSKHLASK